MNINVFNIVFANRTAVEPFILEVNEDEDINIAIAAYFNEKYGEVPVFDWELADEQ